MDYDLYWNGKSAYAGQNLEFMVEMIETGVAEMYALFKIKLMEIINTQLNWLLKFTQIFTFYCVIFRKHHYLIPIKIYVTCGFCFLLNLLQGHYPQQQHLIIKIKVRCKFVVTYSGQV